MKQPAAAAAGPRGMWRWSRGADSRWHPWKPMLARNSATVRLCLPNYTGSTWNIDTVNIHFWGNMQLPFFKTLLEISTCAIFSIFIRYFLLCEWTCLEQQLVYLCELVTADCARPVGRSSTKYCAYILTVRVNETSHPHWHCHGKLSCFSRYSDHVIRFHSEWNKYRRQRGLLLT